MYLTFIIAIVFKIFTYFFGKKNFVPNRTFKLLAENISRVQPTILTIAAGYLAKEDIRLTAKLAAAYNA